MMRAQRILIALTVANAGMLVFSLARPPRTAAQGIVPVLRGRALEMVGTQGVSAPRSKYFRYSSQDACRHDWVSGFRVALPARLSQWPSHQIADRYRKIYGRNI